MENSQVFTPLCIQLVRTGEASGALDQMLQNLADYHSEKTHQLAENLTSLLEPMLLVVTGTIIGTLVVAMYLPIFHWGMRLAERDKRWRRKRQREALQAVEHAVLLFLHADKGGAFGQLFQARGTDVGAR